MAPPNSPIQDLPDELAERLHRLARSETAGSQPWPRVDQALRRSRRRRVAGVSGVAAVVLLAGAAYGGLLTTGVTRAQPVSPAAPTPRASRIATSLVLPGPMTLARAGYTGAIGGSLAGDTGWLAALRTQVIQLSKDGSKTTIRSPKDVLVLWAGDFDGARYAVVLFHATRATESEGPSQAPWTFTTLTGPTGAPAGAMDLPLSSSSGSGIPTTPDGEFLKNAGSSGGVVFVVAPRASGIDVAASRRFSPTGQVTTDWRPLQKQGGAVWVGSVNASELYLSSYRVDGMKGVTNGDSVGAGTDADAVARAVAVPGTDLNALDSATGETRSLGSSSAEHPVLATGIRLSKRSTLAATVLESPDGGFLYGFAERNVHATLGPTGTTTSLGLISTHPFAGPDAFMTAVRSDGLGYLVIAPADATSVRIGTTTVAVRHRLAVLPVTASGSSDQAQVQALGPDGTVIATVPSTSTDDENEAEFGPDQPRQ